MVEVLEQSLVHSFQLRKTVVFATPLQAVLVYCNTEHVVLL